MKPITSLLFALICSASFAQNYTGVEYRHTFTKKTPFATYERYAIEYKGLAIVDGQYLEARSFTGQKLKSWRSISIEMLDQLPASPEGPALLYADNTWKSVEVDTVLLGSQHELVISQNGNILERRDLTAHALDTTVAVRVFNPDPLTPFGYSYGGSYVDMNDGNGSVLDSLAIIDSITVNTNAGSAILENQYLKVVDFDAPYIAPSTNASQWMASRSDDAFEQVMVVYHITLWNQYLDSLGYDSVLNYAIHVDPQALNGQDQSMFNFGYNPPRLYFGEGGVDDAEDADVIIHELSHAISHGAAPNSNTGTERRTFDEAFGDYFAERYGRRLGITSTRVFDWDGNNTFWNGRSISYDGSKNYNTIFFSNIYQHTDLMSSAMLEFSSAAGVQPAIADQIILEAVHMLMPNQGLRKIAQNILFADSLITGGSYQSQIQQSFGPPKNILNQNKIKELAESNSCQLYYTEDGWLLKPMIATEMSIRLFNTAGQLLGITSTSESLLIIDNQVFMIVVTLGSGEVMTFKVP
ncbi:MAG: hypothetical protein VW775_06415 [Schleiferiaceae bacterium]